MLLGNTSNFPVNLYFVCNLYDITQKYSTLRCSLTYQSFDFAVYLGWSGSILQISVNIMKVVQSCN